MPELNLNEFLQDNNSLAEKGDIDTNYLFPTRYERGLISDPFIDTITFNKIAGGTAILGGTANGNGLLQVFNSLGTRNVQLDNDGIRVFGTSTFKNSYISGGTIVNDIAYLGADSSGTMYFQTGVGIPMTFGLNGPSKFQMGAFAAGTLVVNGNLQVTGSVDATVSEAAHATFADDAGTAFVALSADELNPDGVSAFVIDPDIYFLSGTIVKTAIVPTKSGYRSLYTNESPEVWFMDFCESKEKIDPMFMEVTSPPYHYIKCEGGEYQVWGKRRGVEDKRFEVNNVHEYIENGKFWNTPKEKAQKLTNTLDKSNIDIPLQAVVSQSND